MKNLLKSNMGKPKQDRRNIIIIDWRYEYEFTGGHIIGAQNLNSPTQVYKEFFSSPERIQYLMEKDSIIILHCEFSSFRAPQTYNLIRRTDREINECKYPLICYPELYLLENGYKDFYENYPVKILTFTQFQDFCLYYFSNWFRNSPINLIIVLITLNLLLAKLYIFLRNVMKDSFNIFLHISFTPIHMIFFSDYNFSSKIML